MADKVYDWSTTAASNATVESVNWAEGQAPSTVNNSARELMSHVAHWRDIISGANTTTGTSNAYVLSTGQSLAAIPTGFYLVAKANHSNTGAATIAVDGLAAAAINKGGGTALAGNEIKANAYIILAYDGTDFELLNPFSGNASTLLDQVTPATDKLPYFDSASTMSTTDFTATARTLLDDSSITNMRTTLGVTSTASLYTQTAADAKFAQLGAANSFTSANTFTDEVRIADGSAADPSLPFSDDLDTGIFSPGANIWAVAASGTERLRVDTAGVDVTGAITATTDITATANVACVDVNASGDLGGATATLTGNASVAGQVLAKDGSSSSPGYGFSGDTNTGIARFDNAVDVGVAFYGNGTLLARILTNGMSVQALPFSVTVDPTIGTNVGNRDYNDARYLVQSDQHNAVASIVTATVTSVESGDHVLLLLNLVGDIGSATYTLKRSAVTLQAFTGDVNGMTCQMWLDESPGTGTVSYTGNSTTSLEQTLIAVRLTG